MTTPPEPRDVMPGCPLDTDGDGNCHKHPKGCSHPDYFSIMKRNALADPSYCPYCLRCSGNVRMKKVETLLWRCDCGAVHDERDKLPPPTTDAADREPGEVGGCPKCGAEFRKHLSAGAVEFQCGTTEGMRWINSSDECRANVKIRELTRTVETLTRERDAAVADNAEWRRQVQSIANSMCHEVGGCVACGRTGLEADGSFQHYAECVLEKPHPGDQLRDRVQRLERVARISKEHIELWTAPATTLKDSAWWETVGRLEVELKAALAELDTKEPTNA